MQFGNAGTHFCDLILEWLVLGLQYLDDFTLAFVFTLLSLIVFLELCQLVSSVGICTCCWGIGITPGIGISGCLPSLLTCFNKRALLLCLDYQSSLFHHKPWTLLAWGCVWTSTVWAFGFIRIRACFVAVTRKRACLTYILLGSTYPGIVTKLLALEASAWGWDVGIHIESLKAQSYFLWKGCCLKGQEECSSRSFFIIPVHHYSVGFRYKGHVPVPRWGIEGVLYLHSGHTSCSPAKLCLSPSTQCSHSHWWCPGLSCLWHRNSDLAASSGIRALDHQEAWECWSFCRRVCVGINSTIWDFWVSIRRVIWGWGWARGRLIFRSCHAHIVVWWWCLAVFTPRLSFASLWLGTNFAKNARAMTGTKNHPHTHGYPTPKGQPLPSIT